MTIISGGCLCGVVRYEISRPLGSADHCHCSMCRRQHGAAFSTYVDVPPEDFRWSDGESQVKVYEVESGAGWCFCLVCGSSLAGSVNGRVTSVTLGTLQEQVDLKPACHIFVGSKASWYPITDDLPQHNARAGAGK